MRAWAVLGVGVLALAACQKKTDGTAAAGDGAQPPAPAAQPAAGPPARKPGLWTIATTTAGMTQEIRTCLDAETDKELSAWGQQATSDMCSKNEVRPTAGGWAFVSVCDMGPGGGRSTTTGTATGDFNSKYVVKAKVVTEGSSMPQANGTHEMTMTATWSGACPADMAPGDMLMPGGVKISREAIRGATQGR